MSTLSIMAPSWRCWRISTTSTRSMDGTVASQPAVDPVPSAKSSMARRQPEPAMSLPRTVAEILREQVTLLLHPEARAAFRSAAIWYVD
jgi:hypothetical protein